MARPYLHFNVDTVESGIRYPAGAPGGVGGQFKSPGALARELRALNERHAMDLQADVVENVASNIQRDNVSSGRLRAVTANPKNRVVTDFFWGVGNEDFLNSSMAKYWRTIEEGSEIVWADTPTGRSTIIGMELTGIWGGSLGRVTSNRAYGARPWSRHSSRRVDIFVPASRTFNLRGKYTGSGGSQGAPNFKATTTIKNEIMPHHDYATAFDLFSPGARGMADITSILRKASAGAFRVERTR